jgi:hypothetical protein
MPILLLRTCKSTMTYAFAEPWWTSFSMPMGQVCIVSPDALRFLGSALTIRENRVRATDRTAERLLQNAIRLALTPPHEVSTVALPRAEGRALIAKLAPAIIPGADQSQAGARLTLIDLDDRPEPCERVMRDLFGLTG